MSTTTNEAKQTKVAEALALIEHAKIQIAAGFTHSMESTQKLLEALRAYEQATKATIIEVQGITIPLQPGEHYAGTVLDEHCQIKQHLVLMAQRPTSKLAWQPAMDWATSVGGTLPTLQEQALLFANCRPHLDPVWHWSSETHEGDASYAWYCYFSYGHQYYYHKSYEGSAVAVRYVKLEG